MFFTENYYVITFITSLNVLVKYIYHYGNNEEEIKDYEDRCSDEAHDKNQYVIIKRNLLKKDSFGYNLISNSEYFKNFKNKSNGDKKIELTLFFPSDSLLESYFDPLHDSDIFDFNNLNINNILILFYIAENLKSKKIYKFIKNLIFNNSFFKFLTCDKEFLIDGFYDENIFKKIQDIYSTKYTFCYLTNIDYFMANSYLIKKRLERINYPLEEFDIVNNNVLSFILNKYFNIEDLDNIIINSSDNYKAIIYNNLCRTLKFLYCNSTKYNIYNFSNLEYLEYDYTCHNNGFLTENNINKLRCLKYLNCYTFLMNTIELRLPNLEYLYYYNILMTYNNISTDYLPKLIYFNNYGCYDQVDFSNNLNLKIYNDRVIDRSMNDIYLMNTEINNIEVLIFDSSVLNKINVDNYKNLKILIINNCNYEVVLKFLLTAKINVDKIILSTDNRKDNYNHKVYNYIYKLSDNYTSKFYSNNIILYKDED